MRVEVRWSDRGRDRVVHQTVLVNNPGSAGAPAVRTLVIDTGTGTAISPATNHVYATPADNTMPFDLTTSSAPATLHWLLDGTSQAPITTGAGLSVDVRVAVGRPRLRTARGRHLCGQRRGVRPYGVSGAFALADRPSTGSPPSGPRPGRRAHGRPVRPADQVVDLEWLPTPERDIIGYSWSAGRRGQRGRGARARAIGPVPRRRPAARGRGSLPRVRAGIATTWTVSRASPCSRTRSSSTWANIPPAPPRSRRRRSSRRRDRAAELAPEP